MFQIKVVIYICIRGVFSETKVLWNILSFLMKSWYNPKVLITASNIDVFLQNISFTFMVEVLWVVISTLNYFKYFVESIKV